MDNRYLAPCPVCETARQARMALIVALDRNRHMSLKSTIPEINCPQCKNREFVLTNEAKEMLEAILPLLSAEVNKILEETADELRAEFLERFVLSEKGKAEVEPEVPW